MNPGDATDAGDERASATTSLARVRDWTSSLPAPVVLFNKSHSGSRLLAALVGASGVFMGAHQNASGDSEDLLRLVEYVVERHYPGYQALWHAGADAHTELAALIEQVIRSHLEGSAVLRTSATSTGSAAPTGPPALTRPAGAATLTGVAALAGPSGRWGWKLCETAYILPLIDYLFPQARHVHLIRDGRDVAFSNHVPPFDRFWQKIYADSAGFQHWRGLRFGPWSRVAYRIDPLPYNVQHWINSVTVGRHFGAMLRERYLETRYEDLCLDFDREARRVLEFLRVPDLEAALATLRPRVVTTAIGKFRRRNLWQRRRAERLARPLLIALGYLPER